LCELDSRDRTWLFGLLPPGGAAGGGGGGLAISIYRHAGGEAMVCRTVRRALLTLGRRWVSCNRVVGRNWAMIVGGGIGTVFSLIRGGDAYWPVSGAIGWFELTCYAMRIGGFLAAGVRPSGGLLQRFLRLAPGNLFIAFVAAGCLEGGASNIAGADIALATMVWTGREWVALQAGFAAAGGFAAIMT
jgi:hypothetical protein